MLQEAVRQARALLRVDKPSRLRSRDLWTTVMCLCVDDETSFQRYRPEYLEAEFYADAWFDAAEDSDDDPSRNPSPDHVLLARIETIMDAIRDAEMTSSETKLAMWRRKAEEFKFVPKDIWEARTMLAAFPDREMPERPFAIYSATTVDNMKKAGVDPARYPIPRTWIPLSRWDVSKLTTMSCLFHYCDHLWTDPANDVTHWDVRNVTNMCYMFDECGTFNQPIGRWDVGRVRLMIGMFRRANTFNQPLDSWNVSNVRDMLSMFCGANAFNQSLSSWNMTHNPNVYGMFSDCKLVNLPYGWADDTTGRSFRHAKICGAEDTFYNTPLCKKITFLSIYDFLHGVRPEYYVVTFLHHHRHHSVGLRAAVLSNPGLWSHMLQFLETPELVNSYARQQHAQDLHK